MSTNTNMQKTFSTMFGTSSFLLAATEPELLPPPPSIFEVKVHFCKQTSDWMIERMTQCTENHKSTCLSPAVIMWLVSCLHQLACTAQTVSGRRRQAHRCTLRQKWQMSGQTSTFLWLTSVTLLRWWSVPCLCMRCVTMVIRAKFVTACHCCVVYLCVLAHLVAC